MQYIYVLKSLKDGGMYVGRTNDIKQRLPIHYKGRVHSTKKRRPLRFIYAEACNSLRDAVHREKYLKTAWGKRYLKNRLKYDI